MTANQDTTVDLHDLEPDTATFASDVTAGLRQSPRTVPCKYLYDERGSQLFDEICELDEYYPTRTEIAIMRKYAEDIATTIGERCLLIEYGSGSSIKIRLLLDHLKDLAGYVPLDISRDHLVRCAQQLACDYPHVEIFPICADYTEEIELPQTVKEVKQRAAYFPGSTIGNFHKPDAKVFLERVAQVVGPGGGFLIGVDLKKDVATMEAAYNDKRGITAEFNYNLIDRMKRDIDANIDRKDFVFRATWNPDESRIESHLISKRRQTLTVGSESFDLDENERIRTECSYKYTLEEFAELAREVGFEVRKVWTDPEELFSVQYLVVRD